MSKIRLGVLGGGGDSLIGVLHRVASHMFDRYEITGGVFNPDFEENLKFRVSVLLRYLLKNNSTYDNKSRRNT